MFSWISGDLVGFIDWIAGDLAIWFNHWPPGGLF